jgi:uncharacterized protein YjeT (DUF2065 family)
MVTTSSTLTLYLAQAIGLYLILGGLSALVKPDRWRAMMDEFATSPALTMVTGVFVFVLGVTLIHVHCILTDALAFLVTAVGWIALVEGALLMVVPHLLMRIGYWSLNFTRVWAIVAIILGVLLGYAGLTGTAGYPHIV